MGRRPRDEQSTSLAKVKLGKHLLEPAFSTQQLVALCSGEAEFYALGVAVARGLTIGRTLNEADMWKNGWDYDFETDEQENGRRYPKELKEHVDYVLVTLVSDSSAARGICQRHGVGKVRHLDLRFLWLQQVVRDHEGKLKAVEA